VSGEARQRGVARDILDYVLRDMTHPEGGFLFGEDADQRRHEGKFLLLDTGRVAKAADAGGVEVAVRYFGITSGATSLTTVIRIRLPNQNVFEHRRTQALRAGGGAAGVGEKEMSAARSKRCARTWTKRAGVVERPDARRDGAGLRGARDEK